MAGVTITKSIQNQAGGTPIRSSVELETESLQQFGPITIPAETSNVEVAIASTLAAMDLIWIHVEGAEGGELTLETNNSGTPGDTFTIKVGDDFEWHEDGSLANPFTENITTTFFTNAGEVDLTVRGYLGKDITP